MSTPLQTTFLEPMVSSVKPKALKVLMRVGVKIVGPDSTGRQLEGTKTLTMIILTKKEGRRPLRTYSFYAPWQAVKLLAQGTMPGNN